MNTIYRVVFNRARGVLMVANEITSSVQAKGSKTVVATAVAAALSCGAAFAQEYVDQTVEADNNATLQALVNKTGESLELTGDVFKNNTLTLKQTSGNPTAIGVAVTQGNLTLTKTIFDNNAVKDQTGSANGVYGAAVGVSTGNLKVVDSSFIGNTSTGHRQVQGSAIYQSVGTIDIQGSTFNNNHGYAAKDSGANVTGGAVSLWGVSGTIKGTTFDGNTAESTADNIATYGGALYLRDGRWGGEKNLTVTIEDSVFSNNKTISTASKKNGSLGGAIYAKSTYDTDGKAVLNLELNKVKFTNNSSDWMGGALFVTGDGMVTMTDVTFDGNTSSNGGAAMFYANKPNESALANVNTAHIVANNVNYLNNTASDDGWGGALYINTKSKYEQTGGSFVGNKADGLAGGVFVKGAEAVFTDVLFENNVVENPKAFTAGGAVYVDIVKNNSAGTVPGSVKFVLTKDMIYSGNNAIGKSDIENTFGYLVGTSGGFLLLDRGTTATFDIADNATLTIGKEDASGNMDSIASAYPDKNNLNAPSATLTKTGQGTLLINSDMNKYYGYVNVEAGRMDVRKAWTIKDKVNVNGGTLALTSFDFGNQPDPVTNRVGSIVVAANGTLETSSAQVFKNGLGAEGTATDVGSLKHDASKLSFAQGSTLALNDALYNLAYAESAGKLVADGRVVMLGDLVNKGEVDNTQTLDELSNVGPNVDLNKVTVDAEDKNIQIGGTKQNDVAYRAEDLSVGAVDLGKASGVTVDGGKTLTLAGNGGDVIASTAKDVTVDVKNGATLTLGGVASKGGTVAADVNIDAQSQVVVTGNANFTLDAVKGDGKVFVGTNDSIGDVTINSLKDMTGLIVFDPAWTEGVNTVNGATKGQLNGLSKDALKASVAVTRNSIVASDAQSSDAVAAFNAIANAQGLAWKDDVTAAFYAGQQVKIDQTGGILVDGSKNKDTVTDADITKGALTVAKNGMLIVNQNNAGKPVVDGNVTLADKSYLGVVNAVVGEMTITNGTFTNNGAIVATDNPFIVGSVTNKGTLQNKLDVDAGLGTLASAGIQAMTRRADFVMSETVANRTSVDQELNPGLNLWVDVTAERYESDDLEHNGSFRSDSAYAMFGADVAMAQDITVGAGLQYGTGSLRSGVASIKNDIDSYGLTAYAAKKFGQAKVVGELAYIQAQNDITSAQTALNQKVDTKVYSAGIRGQYQLTAGNFQFVPSIGLRVSRLETDAMKVGAVNVDDQNQTYVQMPIALRINGFEQNVSGWQLAPSFKIAYVPTFGDKEIKLLGYEQDVLDTKPVQADFGIRALNGNMLFNADLMLGGGENGTSSLGGKVGMKYVF